MKKRKIDPESIEKKDSNASFNAKQIEKMNEEKNIRLNNEKTVLELPDG